MRQRLFIVFDNLYLLANRLIYGFKVGFAIFPILVLVTIAMVIQTTNYLRLFAFYTLVCLCKKKPKKICDYAWPDPLQIFDSWIEFKSSFLCTCIDNCCHIFNKRTDYNKYQYIVNYTNFIAQINFQQLHHFKDFLWKTFYINIQFPAKFICLLILGSFSLRIL